MKVKQGRISLSLEKEYVPHGFSPSYQGFDIARKNLISTSNFVGKNDPRSLNDKIFLKLCIKEIVNFLNEKGFGENLQIEAISSPSGKYFYKIFLFLVKQIDPFFTFKKKTEEEIPLILKNFFYPFVPPKNIFYSLNNPRVWPTLIGCLKWILELLGYDSQVFYRNSKTFDKEFFPNKSLWRQMTIAYYIFLSGTEKYRKYFQVLWAVIRNKTISQKSKKKILIERIKSYHEKSHFIFFLFYSFQNFQTKKKNRSN